MPFLREAYSLLAGGNKERNCWEPSSGRAKQTGGHSPAAPGDVHTPTTRHWEQSLQGLPRAKPISRAESSLKVPRGDPNVFSEKLGSAAPGRLLLMPDR